MLSGCNKSPEKMPAPSSQPRPDAVTPARETSFEAVTSQLDPGGTVFAYLSTDQWLGDASTTLIEWRGVLQGLPNISREDRQQINQVFGVLTDVVRKSGVEELTGVGLSGVQISPELFRTKMILHHKQGRGDGFLWTMMGTEPHELDGLKLLSKNTALAGFGDFDVKVLWKLIQDEAKASDIPEFAKPVEAWPAQFEQQTKLSWEKVLASFGGEVGIVVTMDDQTKITLPVPNMPEISEPGLMLVAKVNDDLLFNHLKAQLEKSGMAQVTEEEGLQMIVLPLPVPLPIEVKVTIATGSGYLFIASTPKLVTEAVGVKSGKIAGLQQGEEFAALAKHLPKQGNQFFYVDRRFSETVQSIQRESLGKEATDLGQRKLIEKLLLRQKPAYGLSIGSHTATGWQTVAVGNQDASVSLVAAPAVGATAIVAAMVLPAMAKAKGKAQSINCMNNMKQIGLAYRLWSMDHGDKYPFNVSQAAGGTKEFCDVGPDGYDLNGYRHLRVMAQELATPKVLICPSDESKTIASSFDALGEDNVSYKVRTGVSIDEVNPTEVILYCPIHHHKGMADGSVHKGRGN